MKVDIYYDDYPFDGACDYPRKTIYIKSIEGFWSEINNESKFIEVTDKNEKSYSFGQKCYLNKDRIIEIFIDENEVKE